MTCCLPHQAKSNLCSARSVCHPQPTGSSTSLKLPFLPCKTHAAVKLPFLPCKTHAAVKLPFLTCKTHAAVKLPFLPSKIHAAVKLLFFFPCKLQSFYRLKCLSCNAMSASQEESRHRHC